MKEPERLVKSVDEYLDLTSKVEEKWKFTSDDIGRAWYRGQQRRHWRLVPNIVRQGCFDRETEDEIREEFAVRAPGVSGSEPMPTNSWDLYFLMQHYGAPTRLLDWTESPLIALYFAVRDNPGHYDSAVWVLDPYELNEQVIGKKEVISPSATGANPKDTKRVAAWLPERWSKAKLPEDPVAIFPTHIARRISSQKSCFTIHGAEEDGLARFAPDPRACLVKTVIPAPSILDIRRVLRRCGIDDTTIFPDLEGLGRALVTTYQDVRNASPHKEVYVRLRPSELHDAGIGVFAIRRIPKNTKLFAGENEEILWRDAGSLPSKGELRKLYDDFAIIKGKVYGCPTSFNRLTPAWYINESKKPNVRCDENYDFYSLRDINAGEELTVDYATFSDYPDGYSSARPKRRVGQGSNRR
jgi:hypothetical protein